MNYREYFFDKLDKKLDNINGYVGIYGIGKHTEMLLKKLSEKNKKKIIGLIDNKQENIGEFKYKLKIYDLESIKSKINAIIISSDIYQENIYDRIAYLKEKGIKVLRIYSNNPTMINIQTRKEIANNVIRLEKKDYDIWNNFVDESEEGCIFNKTWWLEAVNVKFEIYIVIDKKSKIIAGMVLPEIENRIEMPKLTQTLGIIFADFNDCKYTKKLSKQTDIIESLINVIPNNSQYSINYNYNYTNWLPFMWNGYNQYCRYTYVIENLDNIKLVKANFRNNIKYDINKAKKNELVVKEDLSIEEFYRIDKQTFEEKGMKVPYTFEFIKEFDEKLRKMNAVKTFFVMDKDGEIYASNYIIFDKKSAYYLMGGVSSKGKLLGAASLGLWEAIKFASTVSNKFDFEGSCIRSIEEFFRGFGGTQKMYFNIWRK